MKKIFIFFVLGFSISYSQILRNVDFAFNEANGVIEIEYYYSPLAEEQVADIWIEVSTNGGTTFNKVSAVTGDVGTVQKRGTKKVYWSVFNEYDELKGSIVIKVAGNPTQTMWQIVSTYAMGSPSVMEYNESYQIYYGMFNFNFRDERIKKIFENTFENKQGTIFGAKVTSYPIIYDFFFFGTIYNIKQTPGANLPKKGGINGFGVSASYTLLPIYKYLQPYIGLGYQNSALYIGDNLDNAIEKRNLGSMYLNFGGQLSLASWLKINYTLYKSLNSEINKKWQFTNLNVAIKF
jgi:hypothetical protein